MSSRRVLSFHYTLKNSKGEQIDSSAGQEPMMFLEGAQQIIPGLEKTLVLLNVGDKRQVEVKAAEAYGEYDEALKLKVSRERLPNGGAVKAGDQFQGQGPDGVGAIFTVLSVGLEEVELDGNHPLAGQDLFFDVELASARNATPEELSHGHAHGGDGHHH